MIRWILLEIGIPLDLFGEDHFSFIDRCAFSVAASKIKSYSAAVEIASQSDSSFFFGG